MTEKRIKRPRDPVELAKVIGDITTGQAKDANLDAGKDQAKRGPCKKRISS